MLAFPRMANLNNKEYFSTALSLKDAIQALDVANLNVQPSEFTIGKKLGEGSMAEVFEATYKGRRCAAKKLKSGVSHESSQYRDLMSELHTLANLGIHPNIVNFYGASVEDQGCPVLLVELLDGADLGSFLATKQLGFNLGRVRTYSWILDVLRALSHLHDRDPILMHRDLKPENLLLTRDRRTLKLADFGLAKRVTRERRNSVVHKGLTGTLRWMAPEVLEGRLSSYTEKADVYSASLIGWYLLTGRRPTADVRSDPNARPDPKPARQRWPGVADILVEMWHSDPEVRPGAGDCMARMHGLPDRPPRLLTELPPSCCNPS